MRNWNSIANDEFCELVQDFLKANYPAPLRYPSRRLRLSEARGWYDTLSKHGWIAPAWPVAWGGMGLDPAKLVILIEEQEAYGVARVPDHGIIMVGPLLIQQGTDEQRRMYLPKILSGEHIWCQGYSEPNAGSDLASLQTQAKLQGDAFVVNGQKTWSTLAQDCTHMFLLARTDPAAPKQQGISFLLTPMSAPGITVKPIRTLSGHEEFCEVFFDNVRVPRENLVGALNKGWGVAKALLTFERLFLGSPKLAQSALAKLESVAALSGAASDAAFQLTLATLKLDVQDLVSLYRRFSAQVSNGEPLGPEVSLLKILGTETYARISEVIVETAGSAAMAEGASHLGGQEIDVISTFYNARPATIYGGTNEIQRNILALAVLGLGKS